jgi:AraC family cel operon transcriptional repressor
MVPRLKSSFSEDPGVEANYSFQSAAHATTIGLHRHQFYEIFLVTDGLLTHAVNGKTERVGEGALVFVRPDDVHCLYSVGEDSGHFINLEFSRRSVAALFSYLGPAFDKTSFLGPAMPPAARLSSFEKERLGERLSALNAIPRSQPAEIQLALRSLLFDICTRYLRCSASSEANETPRWLLALREEMYRPERLRSGLPEMVALSRRSHAYLCRAFRRYFAQTPTAFLNEARLNLAAALLRHTQRKVADIAYEAGFDNPGYFHAQFRKRFGLTPAQFRASMPASHAAE